MPQALLRKYILLCSSHLFSAFVPLLIIPRFISHTSEALFGEVILLQTVLTYFNLFIDYNFNLEGIRKIKAGSLSPNEVAREILQKKIQLCLYLFPLYLLVYLLFIPNISILMFLTSYLIPLATAFSPIWYFQGQENFGGQAMLTVFSKGAFVILVYFCIQSPSDAFLYNVLFACTVLIPSLYYWISKKINLTFKKLSILELQEGLKYFSSSIGINFYTSFQMISIGVYMPASSVATYAVVDKVIMGARGFIGLLSVVIYPRMCSTDFNRNHVIQAVTALSTLVFIFGVILFFNGDVMSTYFLGRIDAEILKLTRILAFVPFVVSLNIYAYQYLLSRGMYGHTQKVLLSASVLGVISFLLLAKMGNLVALAWVSLLIEIAVTISLMIIFKNFRKQEHV